MTAGERLEVRELAQQISEGRDRQVGVRAVTLGTER